MNITDDDGKTTRLLSKLEVCERVNLTYPTIWAWMRAGKFPRSRDLGGKICWLSTEIDDWITNRPVRRLKGDKKTKVA
jgi:predicted DNA-binding transcriptional regulator AlpA